MMGLPQRELGVWSACRACAAVAAAILPLWAHAQFVNLEPTAALNCLTPGLAERGAPEYPFDLWKLDKRARVVVDLHFTIADGRPAVKLISMDGDPAFEDAVRDHVRQYRVPCLSEVNGSATLRYEFVFRPDSRQAHYAAPLDLDNERRTRLIQCVRHSSGSESPSYPMRAQAAGIQGRVLLRLRYYAANLPPLAEVFAVEPQGVLAQAVRNWAEGYRMPCLEGPAVEVSLTFIYRFEGDSFGFKPLDLQQVLAATEGIKQQRLHWDTSTMGCPFDLIWQYRQPHLSNVVGELQTLHPARRPLLEWLANAKLNLPGKATAAIFGDTTRISVPCIEIDLKP